MIAQSPNCRPGEVAGRIINFTSPSAEANSWDQTVYSMSKAAVNRLTGGAAPTLLREHGICVSASAVRHPVADAAGHLRGAENGTGCKKVSHLGLGRVSSSTADSSRWRPTPK